MASFLSIFLTNKLSTWYRIYSENSPAGQDILRALWKQDVNFSDHKSLTFDRTVDAIVVQSTIAHTPITNWMTLWRWTFVEKLQVVQLLKNLTALL
jgi:hypothetical protein